MALSPSPAEDDASLQEILSEIIGFLNIESVDQLLNAATMNEIMQRVVLEVKERYEELWSRLPDRLKKVRSVFTVGETSADQVNHAAAEGLVLQALFRVIAEKFSLVPVSKFGKDNLNGAMALTVSSSVIIVGPPQSDGTMDQQQLNGKSLPRDILYSKVSSRPAASGPGDINTRGRIYDFARGYPALFVPLDGGDNRRVTTTSKIEQMYVLPVVDFDIARLRNAVANSLASFKQGEVG